jgi:hypothetical protein
LVDIHNLTEDQPDIKVREADLKMIRIREEHATFGFE